MANFQNSRSICVQALHRQEALVSNLSAFVGLDGFVDEIIHVVDKREDAHSFARIPTIKALANRIIDAAGRSTNIELVPQRIKLGGNGPIMANALASFGVRISYVGALGYPNLHPVFSPLANKGEVFSIAEAAHTDALEFTDGKLMLGKMTPLNDITWPNLLERMGRTALKTKIQSSHLISFVNWTMIPHMSEIWEAILNENILPKRGSNQTAFFDLCDPEKRNNEDIAHAMNLLGRFRKHLRVILGLNEKEAMELAEVYGLPNEIGFPRKPMRPGRIPLQKDQRRSIGRPPRLLRPCSHQYNHNLGSRPPHRKTHDYHRSRRPLQRRLLPRPTPQHVARTLPTTGRRRQWTLRPHRKKPANPRPEATPRQLAQPPINLEINFCLPPSNPTSKIIPVLLPIVKYGQPILRQKGKPIRPEKENLDQLINDMLETMRHAKGVGLAAQQIGQAIQLTVIDIREAKEMKSEMWISNQPTTHPQTHAHDSAKPKNHAIERLRPRPRRMPQLPRNLRRRPPSRNSGRGGNPSRRFHHEVPLQRPTRPRHPTRNRSPERHPLHRPNDSRRQKTNSTRVGRPAPPNHVPKN